MVTGRLRGQPEPTPNLNETFDVRLIRRSGANRHNAPEPDGSHRVGMARSTSTGGRRMKRILVGVAALALTTGAALATSTTTTTTRETTVTTDQQAKIKTYIAKEKPAAVTAPSGVTVSVGSTLPEAVELRTFPTDVGVTQRYTVIGGRTVLVEPSTRKIIQVIE
jgi:hypothetical protein